MDLLSSFCQKKNSISHPTPSTLTLSATSLYQTKRQLTKANRNCMQNKKECHFYFELFSFFNAKVKELKSHLLSYKLWLSYCRKKDGLFAVHSRSELMAKPRALKGGTQAISMMNQVGLAHWSIQLIISQGSLRTFWFRISYASKR